MAKKGVVPIGSLSIKNKGSLVKFNDYYIDLYTKLIESWNLTCQESKYVHTQISPGTNGQGEHKIEFSWFTYKELDSFARLRFDCFANAYYVNQDKVMGIFGVKYTIELDYKKTWRSSKLLEPFLPYFLKLFYQKIIIQWIVMYLEELNNIKDSVRKLLNVSVFD